MINKFRRYGIFLIVSIGSACTSPKTGGEVDAVSQEPDRPNIILVMADDMGYSDPGCFGGEIETPNLDRLAQEGVRLTRFYNASVCCPSRASLMTGLYPHQAGVGLMDTDFGYESYQGRIKHSVATVAEVLSAAGYATIMSGKWHLGTRKGDNPWERGFADFYGIPKGGGVYFWPPHLDRDIVVYSRDNEEGPVVVQPDSATFYSTDAFTDFAVTKIREQAASRAPFFMYLPYIAPHFPQQAPEDVTEKYLDRYAEGWGAIRQQRFERQRELGIVEPDARLSPYEGLEWDDVSEDERVAFARQMAVYAAQVDILDRNIGRILAALEEHQFDENTLVIFLSDNGAQRNDETGFERNPQAVFGSKESFGGYARNWANVCNTPFRKFKHDQYNGGNAAPFIARWPAAIGQNRINDQVGHIMDIFPTCLAVAGVNVSEMSLPMDLQTLEGRNLLPYLRDSANSDDRELYWEHRGNRAVRDGDWKLVAGFREEWSLYNLSDDPTELNDLSAQHPDKVIALREKYGAWADRTGVLPWPVESRLK